MKRILFASIVTLLSTGLTEAWFGRGNCGSSCAPRCARVVRQQQDCPPKCCKTIQVPQTIMVDKVIEVPAIKEVTPRPDIITYQCNAPIEVRTPQPPIVTPQPDIISYKEVPPTMIRTPQAPCVRWYCPDDCDQR